MLRFPFFLNLELPTQCRELVPKAKRQIWNYIWLHIVDARSDRRTCLWINYNLGFFVDTLASDCNPVS
jgi:hypothetical protein